MTSLLFTAATESNLSEPTLNEARPLSVQSEFEPLTSEEWLRVLLAFGKAFTQVKSVKTITRTAGFYAYQVDRFLWRDTEKIIEALDLEAVLVYMGFQMDTRKSNVGSVWRVYRRDTLGLSLTVVRGADTSLKNFHVVRGSLTISTAGSPAKEIKGGNVLILLWALCGGMPAAFEQVDTLAFDAEFWAIASSIETLQPASLTPQGNRYTAHQALGRELLLRKDYDLDIDFSPDYLVTRGLTVEDVQRAFLYGRIADSCYTYIAPKSQKEIKLYSTAFVLTGQDGAILSLNQRTARCNLYPKGSRGDALWRTNDRYRVSRAVDLGSKRSLLAGEYVYVYASRCEVYVAARRWRAIFSPDEWSALVLDLQLEPPRRIVVGEAPIDLLSLLSLQPTPEHVLLVASGGRISRAGREHLQALLEEHSGAILVLAGDNDEEGLRFALQYLNLRHPAHQDEYRIRLNVIWPKPPTEPNENLNATHRSTKAEHTLLTMKVVVQLFAPRTDVLRSAGDQQWLLGQQDTLKAHAGFYGEQDAVVFWEEPNSIVETIGSMREWTATYCFPDRAVYLRELLFSLVSLINERQQSSYIEVAAYSGAGMNCKDYNEWLVHSLRLADALTHP